MIIFAGRIILCDNNFKSISGDVVFFSMIMNSMRETMAAARKPKNSIEPIMLLVPALPK